MYLGSSYRLELVAEQDGPLKLKDGRFCLLNSVVTDLGTAGASKAFAAVFTDKGQSRLARRVGLVTAQGITSQRAVQRTDGLRREPCA